MKDKLVEDLINQELERQRNTIELIASENIASKDVMRASGSVLTNKYAEGKVPDECDTDDWEQIVFTNCEYKSRRYYNGCHVIDKLETLACNRFKAVFGTDYHVNVQPHSGAQANMAVFMSVLEPGDTVLSMDLSNGGHLSHGSPVNFSGKYYNIVSYGINDDGFIDYGEVFKLALEHKPKLIICGASNYSKVIDFEMFGKIRDAVIREKMAQASSLGMSADYDCYLLADIAHIAGLVAGEVHPSPFGIADFVTTTTHKSLRGPRGGVIACKPELAKKIDSAVFPGMQGGPLEHIIAAKAVCFGEALLPEFKEYAQQIIKNARALAESLIEEGFKIVGGVTENHLMTLDLRDKGITGKDAANLLDSVGITVNKNTVPNDPQSPFITSGLRLGVPAITTRGFDEADCRTVGKLIAKAILNKDNQRELKEVRYYTQLLCDKHPLYEGSACLV